jgi:hypothetical protein
LTTVNGFRVTWLAQLDRARLAKEQAEEYGFDVNFTSNTRLKVDKPIPKRAAVSEKPSTSSKSASGLVCSGCGNSNHMVDTCRFRSSEFFNSYPYTCKGSNAHKKLLATYPDVSAISFSLLPKGPHYPSTDLKLRVSHRLYPTLSVRCIPIIQSITLLTSLCLQASTRRRNNAKALLDTGSLAGDFVAARTVKELHLDPFILTDRSKLVCGV